MYYLHNLHTKCISTSPFNCNIAQLLYRPAAEASAREWSSEKFPYCLVNFTSRVQDPRLQNGKFEKTNQPSKGKKKEPRTRREVKCRQLLCFILLLVNDIAL